MRLRNAAASMFAVALLAQCATSSNAASPAKTTKPKPTTTTVAQRPLAERLCAGKRPQRAGTIADPEITEASGVVQSRKYKNVLWVHNDSGDTARVFAITRKGQTLRQYPLPGATATDWEDIAISSGTAGAPDTLYLGDIGDNAHSRENITVYAIPEPNPTTDTSVESVQSERLLYPDGAHDAEAMFVDPASRDLYIVTKELSGQSEVFRNQGGVAAGHPTLQLVATLDLGLGQLVTAGDIAPDGSAIVLRTYTSVFVWSRQPGEAIAAAFGRAPCRAPAPIERQSEAISIDPNENGYVTTSEGTNPPIWHVRAGT
jgi:hypothetical protein